MRPIQYIRRECQIHKLKRQIVAEVKKSFDGTTLLRGVAPKIEEITGFSAVDKVDRVRVIGRIPGYDLFLHLQCRLSNFTTPTTVGRHFFRKYLYLPLERLTLDRIIKYNLLNSDPRTLSTHIEAMKSLARRIAVHEFVHMVDDRSRSLMAMTDMDQETRARVFRKIKEGNFDEEVVRSVDISTGRLVLSEMVAIGTTALVLMESYSADLSQTELAYRTRVAKDVISLATSIDLISKLEEYRNFAIEHRHALATRFLHHISFFGRNTIKTILERTPLFTEILNPDLYFVHFTFHETRESD